MSPILVRFPLVGASLLAFLALATQCRPAAQGPGGEAVPAGEARDAAPSEALSWGSPPLRPLERLWEQKRAELAKSENKGTEDDEERFLAKCLKERFSHDELRALARSFKALPAAEGDWTKFQHRLVGALLAVFLESRDRADAVLLLSTRCPRTLHPYGLVELCVVLCGKASDPARILFEAFSRSETPEGRQAIAAAVRRGFTGLGVRGEDDAEFVANAAKWYEANRQRLEPNSYYLVNVARRNMSQEDPFLTYPLFFIKPAGGAKDDKGSRP